MASGKLPVERFLANELDFWKTLKAVPRRQLQDVKVLELATKHFEDFVSRAKSLDRQQINEITERVNRATGTKDLDPFDIEIISLPDRNFVQINIRDHGPGVTEEDKEKLFQKFFRADNSTTRSTPGTGLGLAIAKALVELQGGEIWIRSQMGEGSTFSFTLPIGSEPI